LIEFFASAAVEFCVDLSKLSSQSTKFKGFFASILDERIDPGNDNSKCQVSERVTIVQVQAERKKEYRAMKWVRVTR